MTVWASDSRGWGESEKEAGLGAGLRVGGRECGKWGLDTLALDTGQAIWTACFSIIQDCAAWHLPKTGFSFSFLFVKKCNSHNYCYNCVVIHLCHHSDGFRKISQWKQGKKDPHLVVMGERTDRRASEAKCGANKYSLEITIQIFGCRSLALIMPPHSSRWHIGGCKAALVRDKSVSDTCQTKNRLICCSKKNVNHFHQSVFVIEKGHGTCLEKMGHSGESQM